jgi:hypothetical protein
MDEMREIVTQEQVEHVFLILAIAGPLAGLVIGGLAARVAHRSSDSVRVLALRGACWGLLGTANWLLWRLYNAITSVLGLDTVVNLVVNLVLFIALGGAVGWIFARRRGAPS